MVCSLLFDPVHTLSHPNPWLIAFFICFKSQNLRWCDVKEQTDSDSFQIYLPGEAFLVFIVFITTFPPQTHELPLPIKALQQSNSSLRLICPIAVCFPSADLSFKLWWLQRAEQGNHKESVTKEPRSRSDDYVKTEGEGPAAATVVYGSQN